MSAVVEDAVMELAPPEKKIDNSAAEGVDDPDTGEEVLDNKENESTNLDKPSEIEPEKSKLADDDEDIVDDDDEEEASAAIGEDESAAVVEEKTEKLSKLPLGRVKNIMKLDPDVNMASQECVFLISKATELFVDSLAKECYTYTVQNKKKTIAKNDVDTAVEAVDCLAFLEGAIDD